MARAEKSKQTNTAAAASAPITAVKGFDRMSMIRVLPPPKGSPLAVAFARIDYHFGPSASVRRRKAAFLAAALFGADHPGVQRIYAPYLRNLRAAELPYALACVRRWIADEQHRGSRRRLEDLQTIRLALGVLRLRGRAHEYPRLVHMLFA